MSNLTIIEHNIETGEIIERDMTTAELKQAEKDKKAYQAELAAVEARVSAKAILLEKLGITEDEAKLLLS